ncbi:MAG: hypothetical protein ACOCQG_03085 [Candidatus Nanoarchaeia archaeon]
MFKGKKEKFLVLIFVFSLLGVFTAVANDKPGLFGILDMEQEEFEEFDGFSLGECDEGEIAVAGDDGWDCSAEFDTGNVDGLSGCYFDDEEYLNRLVEWYNSIDYEDSGYEAPWDSTSAKEYITESLSYSIAEHFFRCTDTTIDSSECRDNVLGDDFDEPVFVCDGDDGSTTGVSTTSDSCGPKTCSSGECEFTSIATNNDGGWGVTTSNGGISQIISENQLRESYSGGCHFTSITHGGPWAVTTADGMIYAVNDIQSLTQWYNKGDKTFTSIATDGDRWGVTTQEGSIYEIIDVNELDTWYDQGDKTFTSIATDGDRWGVTTQEGSIYEIDGVNNLEEWYDQGDKTFTSIATNGNSWGVTTQEGGIYEIDGVNNLEKHYEGSENFTSIEITDDGTWAVATTDGEVYKLTGSGLEPSYVNN